MAKDQKNIASLVRSAVENEIAALGFTIWDLEYVKEGSEWYLRITIDAEKGVDIDDCEKVFRAVDPIITDLDPVENSYHLEISSPGLERDLRTEEHYKAVIGQMIRLKLFTPVEGKREVLGTLISFDGKTASLGCGDRVIGIEKKNISKANVYFDFDSVDLGEDQ